MPAALDLQHDLFARLQDDRLSVLVEHHVQEPIKDSHASPFGQIESGAMGGTPMYRLVTGAATGVEVGLLPRVR